MGNEKWEPISATYADDEGKLHPVTVVAYSRAGKAYYIQMNGGGEKWVDAERVKR